MELIREQEAAGSNPAIPTKHAGREACPRLSMRLPRSFDRHLTVELNANGRQRLSRAGPKGQGGWMRPWLVLNRFLVLTHVGMERAGDARGGEDGAEAGVIIAAAPLSSGRLVVSELGRWPLSSRTQLAETRTASRSAEAAPGGFAAEPVVVRFPPNRGGLPMRPPL